MKTKYIFKAFALMSVLCLSTACDKGFLDAKPKQEHLVPRTIADFQRIMDNFRIFVLNSASGLMQISTDDFVISDEGLLELQAEEIDAYRWERDMSSINWDWSRSYGLIFHCNIVLEGLEAMPDEDKQKPEYRALRGSALFVRSNAFFDLSHSYSKPFDQTTAQTDPGIPLKVSADISERKGRGSVQECYARIISDLKEAFELLPVTTAYKTRPTKAAAQALLARVYLSMADFPNALQAAHAALQDRNELLDYKSIADNSVRSFPVPLPNNNPEILFYSEMPNYWFFLSGLTGVNPDLYALYGPSDRRKKVFFTNQGGILNFKGSYSGAPQLFAGLATDELYLTRAECLARAGRTIEALADLNTLLRKRHDAGFIDLKITDPAELLRTILLERRKELVGRGVRWFDLRRLNKEPALAQTLKRTVNGVERNLTPNDGRYVFLIPPIEISLNPMPQNER
ncbi:RagB/SusD family nutrient uptake outer membrane protein [Pedobacter sp. SYP-B3415]|uniref:RagB/SusD family nutrient uptake outer membrane protein n=1 Tax=Pedobacter sp. SYP-B3415 TaxID=2496641 RepID=UPI00101B6FDC|nr:RagB/SusD family nutrient uptake outer membrane protein [Pedobacter sp. SYP-B3415]